VGPIFGPVMIVWFLAIAACGVAGIAHHPDILQALSPTALDFLLGHFGIAFFALAAIVLAVTGAKALYADMGHFGRRAITRVADLGVPRVCAQLYGPRCTDPERPGEHQQPVLLARTWLGTPAVVILATAATVIASQAVITGAYSVASQASQLGYLPRLRITHTSESTRGQIYVPWINWLLMVSVLTLVFTFRSSVALAYAFGMAVTGTITITTLLYFYVARLKWHTPLWLLGIGAFLLLGVDLLFVAANLTKLVHGAWIPLLIGLRVHRHDDVAAGPRDRHGRTRTARRTAARIRRTAAQQQGADTPGCQERPSSSTAASRPPRWRYAPTSNTTTSGINTSSSCQ
jgi:KUP system potassium uptake protein